MEGEGRGGNLLYACEEAEKAREKFLKAYMILLIISLGIFCLVCAMTITGGGVNLLIFSTVPILMTAAAFYEERRKAPLRIYEGGISPPSTPHSQTGKEVFIPWNRIRRVTVEPSKRLKDGVPVKTLVFHYDGKTFKLSARSRYTIYEPLKVMMILNRKIPDKLDDSVLAYLRDDEKGLNEYERALRNAIAPTPDMIGNAGYIAFLFFILWFVLFVGMLGGVVAYSQSVQRGEHLRIVYFIIFSLFAVGKAMCIVAVKKNRHIKHLRYHAQAGADGMIFPPTTSRLKLHRPEGIPYGNIKKIRIELHPLYYFREAKMETVSGKRYIVPYEVYKKMSNLPFFAKKGGFALMNTKPTRTGVHRGGNVFKNTAIILLIFLLYTASFTISYLTAANPAIRPYGAMIFWSLLYMAVVYIPVLPVAIIPDSLRTVRKTRRVRYMADMEATSTHISLPHAPEKFRRIDRGDYRGARMGKDLAGEYCEIRCRAGKIRLPREAAEVLASAGYEVEGFSSSPA